MVHFPPTFCSLLLFLAAPWVAGKCVEDHSLGKCEKCLTSVQCEHGRFCCPFMKKCVKDSQEACYYPVASCIPVCRDSQDPEKCQCEDKDFPKNWVECTDGSSSSSQSAGSSGSESSSVPDPITKAFATGGSWCAGEYGRTWCWLANDKGEYAKDGEPYKCSTYEGFSAEEWCYHPGKPKEGKSEAGSTLGSSGGSGGSSSSDNFQCPSQWYSGDSPTDPDAKTWAMSHNVFRCMHDVGFAQWSNPVADDIKTYLADKTSMVHSDSYDVKPPAGPAGENLFSGRPASYWKPASATSSWYSEVKDCKSFPGCTGEFSMTTGHFTAMVWAGVKEIGCASNEYGVKGCRYKGNDQPDCTTPNMGGCYNKNLPEAKKSLSACKAKVQECFGGEALPDNIEIKDFSLEDLEVSVPSKPLRALVSSPAAAGLAGLAAMLALFAGAWRVGRWRYAGIAGEAAVPLEEELAGKEEGLAAEGQ